MTPIARFARWFAHRADPKTTCDFCHRELDAGEGEWDKTWRERTCGSDECEALAAALRSW